MLDRFNSDGLLEKAARSSFAGSGPNSPFKRMMSILIGPARPGVSEISAIAFNVWIWTDAGWAAAIPTLAGVA